jgi:hypothetical protein
MQKQNAGAPVLKQCSFLNDSCHLIRGIPWGRSHASKVQSALTTLVLKTPGRQYRNGLVKQKWLKRQYTVATTKFIPKHAPVALISGTYSRKVTPAMKDAGYTVELVGHNDKPELPSFVTVSSIPAASRTLTCFNNM